MNTSPKKPSPLAYGSPRTSPFKRPDSPSSRSPSGSTVRGTTPTSSPTKQTSQQQQHPRASSPATSVNSAIFSPQRPNSTTATPSTLTPRRTAAAADALSQLNPAQAHEMREAFQVLDRDDDGQISRQDVAAVLDQLGLDSSPASLNQYFPPSDASTSSLNLATYLSTFASLLAPMSRPDELTAAFAAFDVDDSGQIDLDELRDALLNTPPDAGEKALSSRDIDTVVDGFTARRAFGKGAMSMSGAKGRGEVFRYLDFMNTLSGAKPEVDALTAQ